MMALDRENLRRYLHEKQGLEPEDFEDDTLLFSFLQYGRLDHVY
jgi:hypothetical protein